MKLKNTMEILNDNPIQTLRKRRTRNGVVVNKTYLVPVDQLYLEPGYNIRDAIGNIESIDDLSNSERKSAERLYHLANEYVAYYEQLLEESGE